MKKVLAWLTCMTLAVGMIGCGNTEKNPDNDSDAVKGDTDKNVQNETEPAGDTGTEKTDYSDVEFRIAWWGGDTRNTQTVDIIENFEQKYPNLKIDVEYGSFGDYFTKLTTQATAGNLPDVYMMDYSQIVTYVESGQMERLDDYIAAGTIDLSDVDDSLISGGVVDGGMYAIATGVNAPCLLYDPAILEQAGLTLKQNPTWSELTEVIEGVYEKTGYRAIMVPESRIFEIYLRSIGKELYKSDNTGYGFDSKDLTAYLENFYDLFESGAALSEAEYDEEDTNGGSLREGTNIWLRFNRHSNNLASAEEEAGKILHMTCEPSADNATVSGTYLKPVMLWGISATSKNKDLAAEFINYFVNDSYVYDVCGTDRGIPISESMREYVAANANESGKYEADFISFLSDGVATEISPPAPTQAAEANSYIDELYEQICYKQLAKDEILEAAAAAIEKGEAVLAQSTSGE